MNAGTRFGWTLVVGLTTLPGALAQSVRPSKTNDMRGETTLCPRLLIDETAWRIPGVAGIGCISELAAVDIDGDLDSDLLLAQDGNLGVWVNDGAGGFRDEKAQRIGGLTSSISSFGCADVDGDGDIDFVMGGDAPDGVPDRLWINRGGQQNGVEGNFVRDNSFPGGPGAGGLTTATVFADVDGDGDPDLLVARGQSAHGLGAGAPNELLINQGLFSGQFVSSPRFEAGPWNDDSNVFSTDAARCGDVDGDGDLDLFLANSDVGGNFGSSGHPNQLLLNDGTGTFTDATLANIFPVREDNSFDAELTDIDGDGDLDILVANSVLSVSSAISGDVLINQGGLQSGAEGAFLDDATSFLEPFGVSDGIRLSMTVGDLDLDGDPEAFVTVHDLAGDGLHNVWLNQGGRQAGESGQMSLLQCFNSYDSISDDALFIDVDGDGDLDVVQAHCGSATGAGAPSALTLYRNTFQ